MGPTLKRNGSKCDFKLGCSCQENGEGADRDPLPGCVQLYQIKIPG